ncbi:DNA pantothenate metabolism flavoprotein domain-containing protein [Cyclospora cayetanensis]|uniref:DNA pantothenate metabolism flavoprotein domain-containing protein n=1 Tax=Cyclospora cayetanensis TaxID=88456 RepID=A0A1D3DAB6_9EIME|nr:DNA pantothenate metabolism flavoprotein domain-containing protein [Cyclospora cayetanensis]
MRREDTNKSAQGVPTNPSDPSVSTTTTTPGKGHRQGRSNVEGDIEFPRSQEPHRVSTKSHEGAHHSQFSSFSRTESSPCDCFFASEPPPPNVATAGLRVRQFVRPLQEKKELLSVRVAVVTAGGTDVPLEREAVRYLTNTSSGTRGAALCEQLLMLGYYVIFLTSGELPVPAAASTSRRLASQASTEGPQGATVTSLGSVVSSSDSLAAAQERASYEEGSASDGVEVEEASEARDGWRVVFREPRQRGGDDYEALEGLGGPPDPVDALGWMLDPVEAAAALQLYRQCKDRLLCISYQTLVEYAFLVRAVAAGTCSLKERLMFCSAAAVADFYVPYALMAPHKIVASHDHGGPLSHHPSSGSVGEATSKEAGGIEMLLVVRSVAPNCFLVGFKLETNPERLQQSALAYLEGPRPGGPSGAPEASGVADCVVGNLQQTRRAVVKLFTRAGQKELKQKHKPKPGCLGHGTIEARLSRYLSKLHTQKMDEGLV